MRINRGSTTYNQLALVLKGVVDIKPYVVSQPVTIKMQMTPEIPSEKAMGRPMERSTSNNMIMSMPAVTGSIRFPYLVLTLDSAPSYHLPLFVMRYVRIHCQYQ